MNYWIFQAKPSRYDLNMELREGSTEEWSAYQNYTLMNRGDVVFFWQAGEKQPEKRGIYGWGIIAHEPINDKEWGWYVTVEYKCRFPKFIPANELKENEKFSNHQLFKFAIGTNFKVSGDQVLAITQEIQNRFGEKYLPKGGE